MDFVLEVLISILIFVISAAFILREIIKGWEA